MQSKYGIMQICVKVTDYTDTMAKHEAQPKTCVHIDFLAEIDIRHQHRMIECSF